MPVAQTAANIANKVKQHGPKVSDKAQTLLQKATGGKVKDLADLASYVGNSQTKLKTVGEAVMQAGVHPSELYPDDICGRSQVIAQLRNEAMGLAAKLQLQYAAAGGDVVLDGILTDQALVAVIMAIKRVKAAIRVFGSQENYYLCNPGGGISAKQFEMWNALRKEMAA